MDGRPPRPVRRLTPIVAAICRTVLPGSAADYALLFSHTHGVDRELPPEVNALLVALSDVQRKAIVLRFGLDRDLPRTFEEVAQRLGCSELDARDAVESAMEHLPGRP